MDSMTRGTDISAVQVTSISKHGLWLRTIDKGLFIPFQDFPVFQNASVSEIMNVRRPVPNYLYWPDLGMELAVRSIQRFPLVATESRTPPPPVAAQ